MWTRVLGGAGALALALALIWLYGDSRARAGKLTERLAWQEIVANKERQIADLRVANAMKTASATTNYVQTVERMQPIVVQSEVKVRDYAATPAGAVRCLAADRVRGIEAAAAALGLQPAAAARSGDGTVPPDADAARP